MWKVGNSGGWGSNYGGGKDGGKGTPWEIDPESSRADNEMFRATRRLSIRLRHGLCDQLNEAGPDGVSVPNDGLMFKVAS